MLVTVIETEFIPQFIANDRRGYVHNLRNCVRQTQKMCFML